MIEADVVPVVGEEDSDAILNHHNNLAVCTILKLLRTIAVDGFRSDKYRWWCLGNFPATFILSVHTGVEGGRVWVCLCRLLHAHVMGMMCICHKF